MAFRLLFTDQANADLADLELDASAAKRLKAVRKALGLLQHNPRHPSLNTHAYEQLSGANGEMVDEPYAENLIPASFRIFLCYCIRKSEITFVAITTCP